MSEDYLKVANVLMNETKWECETSLKPFPFYVPYPQHMTLRDHFAGLAMQGLVNFYDGQSMNGLVARDAYAIADAMLKERGKEK